MSIDFLTRNCITLEYNVYLMHIDNTFFLITQKLNNVFAQNYKSVSAQLSAMSTVVHNFLTSKSTYHQMQCQPRSDCMPCKYSQFVGWRTQPGVQKMCIQRIRGIRLIGGIGRIGCIGSFGGIGHIGGIGQIICCRTN